MSALDDIKETLKQRALAYGMDVHTVHALADEMRVELAPRLPEEQLAEVLDAAGWLAFVIACKWAQVNGAVTLRWNTERRRCEAETR